MCAKLHLYTLSASQNYERRRSFLCFLAGSGFLGAAPTSGVFPTATMAMRVLGMRDMRREIMSFVSTVLEVAEWCWQQLDGI